MDSNDHANPPDQPMRDGHEAAASHEIEAPARCTACGCTTFEDLWAEGLCFDASMP